MFGENNALLNKLINKMIIDCASTFSPHFPLCFLLDWHETEINSCNHHREELCNVLAEAILSSLPENPVVLI